MSTLFSINSGNLTDSIFARTILNADTTSVSAVMGIGNTPVDISTFTSDGSNIWGVSFNVERRSSNPVGSFLCQLFTTMNELVASVVTPISNFAPGINSDNFDGKISQSWQTIKFDNPISTQINDSYYLRLSASSDGELFLYGLPQLDETIVDFASNSDVVITGNASQGSFNPHNANAWSLYVNDGGYLTHATNAAFNLGTSNFTIDFWVYLSEVRNHRIVSLANLNIDALSSNLLAISGITTNLSVPQDTWAHIAITRNGNVLNGYVDGVKSNDITIANNLNFDQNSLFLGRDRAVATNYMHGHLYNFRIVKNQCLYSTNFSRPTTFTTKTTNGGASPSDMPVQSNIEFLILDGKNYLNGVNRKIVNGSLTKAKPVSPYTTYTNCGYFEAGGAIYPTLSLPNPGTNSFTVETWFKTESNNVSNFIILDCRSTVSDAGAVLYVNNANDKISYQDNGSQRIVGSVITPRVWYHCALVRESGQPIKLYLDGVLQGSYGTASTSFSFGGRQVIGTSYLLNENLDGLSLKNFRITNTAVYTGDFTPPDSDTPLSSIAGTQLLLHFNNKNKQITDRTGNYDLLIGGAPILSPDSMEGRGSVWFDGTNSILSVPNPTFNTSEFTLRCKVRLHSDIYAGRGAIISKAWGSSVGSFRLEYDGRTAIAAASRGVTFRYSVNGTSWNSIFLIQQDSMGRWGGASTSVFDFAFVFSNNIMNAFVNGNLLSAVATTGPLFGSTQHIYIGNDGNGSLKGWLDNIVLVNRALYTSNFAITGSDYYYKDAEFWIDGNGESSSDLSQSHSQFKDMGPNNRAISVNLPGPIAGLPSAATQRRLKNVSGYSYAIGPNYGNYKNVTTDYIELPKNLDLETSISDDFTLECWVKTNATTIPVQPIISVAGGGLNLRLLSGVPIFGYTSENDNSCTDFITTSEVLDNGWHHIAVVRESNNVSLYVDGTSKAATFSYSPFKSGVLRIGADFATPINLFDGYISDLRYTKGQALYNTPDFTLPTSALTHTSNGGATPSTLPLSANVIILEANNISTDPASDISYPALVGNASLTQAPSAEFSPFTSEEIYNLLSHGGSIYFDGASDMITVSERTNEYTLSTGDFTAEFWYYAVGDPTGDTPFLTWQGSDVLADGIKFSFTNATTVNVQLGNNNTPEVTLDGVGSFTNQWNHIAVTRSGNVYKLFINGQVAKTAVYVGLNLSNDNNAIKLGENNCKGYISDVRLTKGQSLYNEYFIPSNSTLTLTNNGASGLGVATLTTIPNLLINGTKAGIYDGSANNNILVEGAAFQVGLSETIYSDTNYTDNALIFNGVLNNNYLQIPASPSLDFSGDFWIDFWMNTSKWKTDSISRRILTLGSVSSVSALHVCINATDGDKKLHLFSNTNILSTNFDYADGGWRHVGIGRKGSTLSIYRDGVFDASAVNTVNYTDGAVNGAFIGIYGDASRNKGRFGGKLVGLRIINGECVHTSNYSLPSEHASLNSDGGVGINNPSNVVFLQKLNNVVSPLNHHIIVSNTQFISSIYVNDNIDTVVNQNVLSSFRLPARSAANTKASFFNPIGSAYLGFPVSNFQMNGDFTIETYVYPMTGNKYINPNGVGTYERTIWSLNDFDLAFYNNTYQLRSSLLPNGANLSAAGTLSAWSHVAVCRKGNNVSLYVNGTRTPSTTATIDGNLSITRFNMGIIDGDGYGGLLGLFYGDIYNTRIIDGRAVYDGNFNTTTTVVPSSLSTTIDTILLYNNADSNSYYKTGPIKKLVLGGYIDNTGKKILTYNADSAYSVINNVQVQNGGTLLATNSGNSFIAISNDGLKICAGGQFTLSAEPSARKTIAFYESKIAVLPGGSIDIKGTSKTKSVDLSGYYAAQLSAFTLNQTPTNWLSGDSLIFMPNSADRTTFEELTARRTSTNRLSTNALTQFDHHQYNGIPSVVNASRNVAIKGLTSSRRGYIQFDSSSNSYICDAEFEHMGRDGAKTESLIFNVKQSGYFLLSGCYLDGSTGTSINATSFYRDSYNVNIRDNVFYKYSDSTIYINKGVQNLNISNNLSLNSTNHGLKLVNASIGESVLMQNNLAISNGGKGIYLENTDGNITGWNNWLNAGQGINAVAATIGQNIDLANSNANMTESNTTNLVKFDSPFGENCPQETSVNMVAGSISWDASSDFIFSDDFTFECFFKFYGTAATTIFGCNIQNTGGFILSYIPGTFEFRFQTYVGTTATTRITKPQVFFQKNKWHHVALVRTDDLISLFVAGEKLGSISLNDEFVGTDTGISLGRSAETATTNKSLYAFRVLKRAEYDASASSINVPTSPFTTDSDTVILYKKAVKNSSLNINNILNTMNRGGGILLDNNDQCLKNTKVSNVSCIANVGYGMSVDGTNTAYTSAQTFTATDMYIVDNTTIGINVNNSVPTISGIYMADNVTAGARIRLGDGKTNISSLTSLMKSNSVPNLIIHASKSYQNVIFDNIVLDKSSNLAGPYTVAPLQLSACNFSNFSFDNSTLNTSNTAFAVSLSGSIDGSYIFTNTTITSSGVRNLSCLPDENIKSAGIVFYNKNKIQGQHETIVKNGRRSTDTSIVSNNIGEKLTPSSTTKKLKSGKKYIVVNQGDTVTVNLKIAVAANYNGSNPRLMMSKNPALGFDDDVVLYTYAGNNTSYDSITVTTPAPSIKGILELYVDCDGNAGSVYIDSWNLI